MSICALCTLPNTVLIFQAHRGSVGLRPSRSDLSRFAAAQPWPRGIVVDVDIGPPPRSAAFRWQAVRHHRSGGGGVLVPFTLRGRALRGLHAHPRCIIGAQPRHLALETALQHEGPRIALGRGRGAELL